LSKQTFVVVCMWRAGIHYFANIYKCHHKKYILESHSKKRSSTRRKTCL